MINTDHYFKVLLPNCIYFNFIKFPLKNEVANEQKNGSVMHGKSRAKKVILGHAVHKVLNNMVFKETLLIKCKA